MEAVEAMMLILHFRSQDQQAPQKCLTCLNYRYTQQFNTGLIKYDFISLSFDFIAGQIVP